MIFGIIMISLCVFLFILASVGYMGFMDGIRDREDKEKKGEDGHGFQ